MSSNGATGRQAHGQAIEAAPPVDSPSENYLVEEHLRRMPPLFARGLVYVMTLLVITAVTYACLAKVDITVKCQAVARPKSHKIRVLSDRDGYIGGVLVAEGQAIEARAPLFIIRSKETVNYQAKVEDLRQRIPLEEERFDVRLAIAKKKLKLREEKHRSALKVIGLKLGQAQTILNSIKEEEKYWRREVEVQSRAEARLRELRAQGATPESELAAASSKLERARTEVKKLMAQQVSNLKQQTIHAEEKAKELSSFGTEMAILVQEVRSLEIDKQTTLKTLRGELVVAEKMLAMRQGDAAMPPADESPSVIRSEKAGTISELKCRNVGDYVRVADLLCTIVPAGTPLYMDITVSNKDVGLLEERMRINYKFDAFPYADHGTISGQVIAIAPSAVKSGEAGFVYHVRGTLDQRHFEFNDKSYPIKAGMTAMAEIVTEKRTLMSLLFKKLKER